MPVLPSGPALRDHVPVWPESHAIGEGCRAVAAYLHKTDVRDFHDGDVALFVETRYGKSREPQNLLHFGETFGDFNVRIRRGVGEIADIRFVQIRRDRPAA